LRSWCVAEVNKQHVLTLHWVVDVGVVVEGDCFLEPPDAGFDGPDFVSETEWAGALTKTGAMAVQQ
jgi:hypothetical protein